MALSRPFLLALLGVALLGATVFAVSNARNKADDSAPVAQQTADPASTPAQATPAQETPASTASVSPQELLRGGLTPDSLESASFKGALSFTSQGKKNTIKTSGAFELAGPKEMPKVDVQVNVNVPGFDGRAGFVTTGPRAWLTRGETGYAVPQKAWQQIVAGRKSGAAPAAATVDVDPSSWLRNVKSEGTQKMDGVDVTHVSADVNSSKAITDVVKAVDRTGQIPAGAEARIAKVVKSGHLDAWVGDDKIMRRVSLDLTGKGTGGSAVAMDLDFRLSGVNEPQDIGRPAKVKHVLPGGLYGQFANGFVTGLGSSVGVNANDLQLDVPTTNSHLKAERAVADNRKVVIFFQNPKGIDDRAVARSVRSLDRRTKSVVVLTDDVRNADRYGSMVEDLGVNQAPAIVVIGRSGKASLIEGYIDAESLVQVVADAR